MKLTRTLAGTLIMSAMLVALSGCEKQGPAEKAGESIDKATESLGEHIEETGEAIQDAAEGNK